MSLSQWLVLATVLLLASFLIGPTPSLGAAQSARFSPAALGLSSSWRAMPDWLDYDADQYAVTRTENGLDFSVRGATRGMKWLAILEQPADAEVTPWLVLRYRCRGYNTSVDYLLWLEAEGVRGGVYALRPENVRADGEWHLVALDLEALGCGVVSRVAVQCRAVGDEAHLDVAELRFADARPADAEALPGARELRKLRDYDLTAPDSWRAEPSWLGNPSSRYEVTRTPRGVCFTVRGPGLGMKFSHQVAGDRLPQGYFKLAYRATGVDTAWSDYVFYAANAPGGRAPDEQYVFRLNQLTADGQPHVLVGYCKVDGAVPLAVQVQVAPGAEEASLEIGPLEIWAQRPPTKLEEIITAAAGWAADMKIWRPVAMPAGLGRAEATSILGIEGWWPAEQVTVQGVPFLVRDGAVLGTSRSDPGALEVPLAGRARQLYLLLGAWLPTRSLPGYSPEASGFVEWPHRFVCEIRYRGGRVERQMPTALGSSRVGLSRGVGAYALACDSGSELESLAVVDGHRRGAVVLFAVTASTKDGPATVATRPVPAAKLAPRSRRSGACAVDVSNEGEIRVDSGATHLRLLTRRGLELAEIRSDYLPDTPTLAWAGSLFAIKVGDIEVRSGEATVTSVTATSPTEAVVSLTLSPALPIDARLTIAARQPDEVFLGMELIPTGDLPLEPQVLMPVLTGAKATQDPAETWVFYPCRGAVISSRVFARSNPYGGMFPLQVMGLYAPTGGGLYLRTEYTEPVDRRYEVEHGNKGVMFCVRYPWWRGGKLNAVIGTNPGDWHDQLSAYNRWRETWFRPAAPRKDWFRRIFNFRQQFLTFAVPLPSGMFDPETKSFRLLEVLEQDKQAFGGVDFLHIFDWGWSPQRGRCGDYAPWDYLGGAENFRRAVEGVKAAGIPVGLYIEGYLVSPESSIFERARAWQVIKANGEPLEFFAPEINMCPWVREWQDYLSAVYRRVAEETGAMGFYIDEYGFAHDGHACYAKDHGHPSPVYAAAGELETTRKVRAALGPDRAIYTEETPCDVTMQYQDGSFTYAITSANDQLSPSHVNITRFAVPDFKTIEILFCDQPLRDDLEDLGRILFNGEAIWLEGTPQAWFDQRSLEFIQRMHTIMRAEADCFTSPGPEPLVPTLWRDLHANRFPRADGKRCIWTLYWRGPRTLEADLLAVPHVPGARYRELWANRPLSVRRDGSRDIIRGAIHPHEVLVLLQDSAS